MQATPRFTHLRARALRCWPSQHDNARTASSIKAPTPTPNIFPVGTRPLLAAERGQLLKRNPESMALLFDAHVSNTPILYGYSSLLPQASHPSILLSSPGQFLLTCPSLHTGVENPSFLSAFNITLTHKCPGSS